MATVKNFNMIKRTFVSLHKLSLFKHLKSAKRQFTTLFAVYLALHLGFASQAQAEQFETWPSQAKDRYQVEFIVFKYSQADTTTLIYENHSPKYYRTLSENYSGPQTFIVSSFTPMTANQHSALSPQDMVLGSALNKLSRSHETDVLTYSAWIQEIDDDATLAPVAIDIPLPGYNPLLSGGGHRLQGEITIRRSRYMHLAVDLSVSEFRRYLYNSTIDWLLDSSPIATYLILTPLDLLPETPTLPSREYINWSINLGQSRRIKDGEVHYIDHPLMGVVATIKKLKAEDDF